MVDLVVEVSIVATEVEEVDRELFDILVGLILVEDDMETAHALEHVHLPRACVHKRT